MGIGGVLGQAVSSDQALDEAIRSLIGQALGFLALIGFALWLWRRDRRRRHLRPPPSGWYPDPWGQPLERWWNGASWTPDVRPAPWTYPMGYGMPPGPGAPTAPPGPGGTAPGWQAPPASSWTTPDQAAPPPSAGDRAEGGPPSAG